MAHRARTSGPDLRGSREGRGRGAVSSQRELLRLGLRGQVCSDVGSRGCQNGTELFYVKAKSIFNCMR